MATREKVFALHVWKFSNGEKRPKRKVKKVGGKKNGSMDSRAFSLRLLLEFCEKRVMEWMRKKRSKFWKGKQKDLRKERNRKVGYRNLENKTEF